MPQGHIGDVGAGLVSARSPKNLPNVALTQEEYPNIVGADPTNPNRIILKIVNTKRYEPIKAKIAHNTQEQKIEITITYTANGISKVIDEYGEELIITEENGLTIAKTKYAPLASGTYAFTVIDNKENKKELSIAINLDSFYKVAYINGIDNMDNTATYNKTQETKTTAENALINQLTAIDNSKTLSRAITDSNNGVTTITETSRLSSDEQLYVFAKFVAKKSFSYSLDSFNGWSSVWVFDLRPGGGYTSFTLIPDRGVMFSDCVQMSDKSKTYFSNNVYVWSTTLASEKLVTSRYC